jgi:hypothetical protein
MSERTCNSCNGSGSKTEYGTSIGTDWEGNVTVTPITDTKTCTICYGSGKTK